MTEHVLSWVFEKISQKFFNSDFFLFLIRPFICNRICWKYDKYYIYINNIIQEEILSWICAVTGEQAPEEKGAEAFKNFLSSGNILCNLVQTLDPNLKIKTHDTSKIRLAALRKNKENENIAFFLDGCEKYGLNKMDLFQVNI